MAAEMERTETRVSISNPLCQVYIVGYSGRRGNYPVLSKQPSTDTISNRESQSPMKAKGVCRRRSERSREWVAIIYSRIEAVNKIAFRMASYEIIILACLKVPPPFIASPAVQRKDDVGLVNDNSVNNIPHSLVF